ncbi:MAG: LytTR family transcriptional regulator [Bacteroidales bacterium]|nr:LytTR family transcriptional regulator [Bacteroidales bacterium]
MKNELLKKLETKYPRNYIIRHPHFGTLIIAGFCLLFMLLYRPLDAKPAPPFNYFQTILLYSLGASVFVILGVKLLNTTSFFSRRKKWTFLKETLSIIFILLVFGIGTYLMGFFIEPPAARWNFPTFFDSVFSAFLIGIIPVSLFTLVNYAYLISKEPADVEELVTTNQNAAPKRESICIDSTLKKEKLEFYSDQFIYAESDGNYVVFYLQEEGQVSRKVIRNSISNVEKQLSAIPQVMRTHRAFIVNVKKVVKKRGSISSGYRLKLLNIDEEVPVSRKNTSDFDSFT